ncbi:hypothetical protein [Spirochaeta cellobiosiphila]|uniref:hypothetical protein n=1 Tax=Spirochaeta cellobiosiphila TaxID=504483 RepID=UPI00042A6C6A|nr:hypothetical protein [Spirochaeta cellobiosiphila]
MKFKGIVLVYILLNMPLIAQDILASTSLTQAFALAAGVRAVKCLAPVDSQNPAEYKLTGKDLKSISQSDYLIFSGYEAMVKQITTGTKVNYVIPIKTDLSIDTIKESLLSIAHVFGSEKQARISIEEIQTVYSKAKQTLSQQSIIRDPVLVNVKYQALANELGLNVIGLFGPDKLTAQQLQGMSQTNAKYIIDDSNYPVGKVLLADLPGTGYISWIRFPGIEGTKTLSDVIEYNVRSLVSGY